MAESTAVAEKPQLTFPEKVEEAIELLGSRLEMIPEAQGQITAHALHGVNTGEPYPSLIFFDHKNKSYGYSGDIRERAGIIPIDAVALKEGSSSLFMQISRSTLNPDIKIADIELMMEGKDEPIRGEEALREIPNAFPDIFPPVAKIA